MITSSSAPLKRLSSLHAGSSLSVTAQRSGLTGGDHAGSN
jgi:hypothetical protein